MSPKPIVAYTADMRALCKRQWVYPRDKSKPYPTGTLFKGVKPTWLQFDAWAVPGARGVVDKLHHLYHNQAVDGHEECLTTYGILARMLLDTPLEIIRIRDRLDQAPTAPQGPATDKDTDIEAPGEGTTSRPSLPNFFQTRSTKAMSSKHHKATLNNKAAMSDGHFDESRILAYSQYEDLNTVGGRAAFAIMVRDYVASLRPDPSRSDQLHSEEDEVKDKERQGDPVLNTFIQLLDSDRGWGVASQLVPEFRTPR